MKKILLLIFWAATIVLCSFALPNDQSVISDVIPKEYVEIMEQQKEPLAAYQTLYSTFNQDDKGRYVYPDEYAGEWLDGNKLVIALTDVSKEKLDKYIDILKHYNCVKFVKAKYSITFLYKLADEVFETLNDMNITKYGVDVENNKLTFGYIGDVNNFKKEITEIFPDYVSIISVYSSNLCK
ncbi:MAG: hypothetical protein J6N15_00755 [Ruminiclostridium sp.]|nr:hypothetical protein [Ruminiclostridium sp.]